MSKIEEDKKDNGTINKTEKKVAPKKKTGTSTAKKTTANKTTTKKNTAKKTITAKSITDTTKAKSNTISKKKKEEGPVKTTKKNETIKKSEKPIKESKKQNDVKIKKKLDEGKIVKEDIIEENIAEETPAKEEKENESKYDTISLKEIREALGNRVEKSQRSIVIKEALINIGIAVIMIIHLGLLVAGSKNIEISVFEKDMKIITLFIALIGIIVLEVSYKKDKIKLALNAVEILVFGAANLCLIYVGKLYMGEFLNFSLYVGAALIGYYIIKIISVSIVNVRKYKKENNDIKEIVKR